MSLHDDYVAESIQQWLAQGYRVFVNVEAKTACEYLLLRGDHVFAVNESMFVESTNITPKGVAHMNATGRIAELQP